MSTIKIEFFHDVICSFCFPMSYRMRQLQERMPEVSIIHRSFALVRAEQDFARMFGSRAAAKEAILGHWVHANQNDTPHRFNIAGMRAAEFPFPTSMKGLAACKAAGLLGGDTAYWDVFDALQNAMFVQSRNIEEDAVIAQCIKEAGIDVDRWRKQMQDKTTMEAVEADLLLAQRYGIDSVPCLIVNETYKVSGAQPLERIIQAVHKADEDAARRSPPAGLKAENFTVTDALGRISKA